MSESQVKDHERAELAVVADRLLSPVLLLDGQARIAYVNAAAALVLRQEIPWLTGRDFLEMVHPADQSRMRRNLQQLGQRRHATAFPPDGERVEWRAEEVVIELFGKPHLMVRVTINGPLFPHRALEPIVEIGETRSRFVRISEDGLRADAYFERMPTTGGKIHFGHGPDLELVVPEPFTTERVKLLDRQRLADDVRFHVQEPEEGVTDEVGRMRGGPTPA